MMIWTPSTFSDLHLWSLLFIIWYVKFAFFVAEGLHKCEKLLTGQLLVHFFSKERTAVELKLNVVHMMWQSLRFLSKKCSHIPVSKCTNSQTLRPVGAVKAVLKSCDLCKKNVKKRNCNFLPVSVGLSHWANIKCTGECGCDMTTWKITRGVDTFGMKLIVRKVFGCRCILGHQHLENGMSRQTLRRWERFWQSFCLFRGVFVSFMTLGCYVGFLCRLEGLRRLLQDGAESAEHMARGSCLRNPSSSKLSGNTGFTISMPPPLFWGAKIVLENDLFKI